MKLLTKLAVIKDKPGARGSRQVVDLRGLFMRGKREKCHRVNALLYNSYLRDYVQTYEVFNRYTN